MGVGDGMPQLDRLKEQVAYLKFWLGIVVVTNISLIGWLMSAFDTAGGPAVVLAAGAFVLLILVTIVLHRYIERRIEHIGRL
jgi:hypothetical protein